MAIKPFNSINGFSVSGNGNVIIDSAGNITTDSITANLNANLGNIANVKIGGGSSGYVIATDGAGNLSFVAGGGGGGNLEITSPMPTLINSGETYYVTANHQGLFSVPIEINGALEVDGVLVQTDGIAFDNSTSNKQVFFNDNSVVSGSANLTFDKTTSTLTANNFVATSTANLGAVGNVTITGGTSGQYLQTNGSGGLSWSTVTSGSTSNISNGTSNVNIPTASGNVNISSAGNANIVVVTGTGANINGTLSVSGNSNVGNIGTGIVSATGNVTAGNVSTAGNVAAGNVLTNNLLYANGAAWSFGNPSGISNGTSNVSIATSGGNVTTSVGGTSNVVVVTTTGANVTGTLSASGNITTAGNISSTGNISGFDLNLANLTIGTQNRGGINYIEIAGVTSNDINLLSPTGKQISQASDSYSQLYWTSNIANVDPVNGNDDYVWAFAYSTGFNVSGAGGGGFSWNKATDTVSANNVLIDALSVTGISNLNSVSNVTITGGTSGQYLQTDGTGNLSWSTVATGSSSNISNGTSNVNIGTSGGNVTTSVDGNANILVVTGTGANITGTLSVSGNANVGNIGTGIITATGNITGANLATGGTLSVSGNANVGNIGATGGYFTTVAGNLTTAAQPNITSTGTLTTLSVSGNANVGNIGISNIVTATGNINGGNLNTGGLVSAAGNVLGGNLTTGGKLSVTGNANIGNIGTGILTATGNIVSNANGIIQSTLYVGSGATTTSFLNPTIIAVNTGATYIQAALVNQSATGSADFIMYGDNGNDVAGWSDTGFTGSNFNDANYTITGKNDGYFFVQPVNGAGLGGNLVLATGDQGANRDIVFATGGFLTGNEKMRLYDAGSQFQIKMTTPATTSATGALTVAGGVGVAGNLYVGGLINSASNINGANLTTGGVVSATGNVTGGNINTGGTMSSTGNAVHGNISTGGLITATGNVTGGNLTTGGLITATGNITGANISTGGLITATGNITGGNLNTGGIISVTGTGVSSINGNLNMNSKYVVSLSDPVNSQDAATKAYVDSVATTGLSYHPSVTAATTTTLAITTGGTITYNNGASGVGANLVTTGSFNLIDTANVQTVGTRILVKNEANAAWNGVYTWANSSTIVRSSDTNSYGSGVNQLSQNDYFFVDGGNVNKGSAYVCTTVGTIVFGTTNITFSQFSSSQTYTAGTGIDITGTTISANASQTQVTAVGTLTTLSVSGNANIGNIGTAGQIISTIATGTAPFVVSSTTQVANLSVATAGTASTVTTNSQPNITSTGTLASLSVSGNANIGNIGTGIVTATGNITGANITTAGILVSSIATGTAPLTVTSTTQVANLNAATAGTAGTVTAASQGNITSVGILTSVSVSGNANVGNLNSAGRIYAVDNMIVGSSGGEGGQIVVGYVGVNNITGQANGTWNMDVDSSNNFRLFSQNATGVVSAITMTAYSGNNNTSFAGNVSAPYFIGNGSQLTGIVASGGSSITNGTSNVVVDSSGNVRTSVAGTGNVMVVSSNTVTAPIFAATDNGNGTNFKVGDDVWIGDINTSDTMGIRGQQSGLNGYIVFGNSDTTSKLGRAGTGPLTYAGAFSASGNITGAYILGNGSQLTGIVASAGAAITNGNSNVTVVANSNITMSVTSTPNVMVITTTGANIAGTLSASGNITGANLTTGGTANAATLTVSGNANIGNIGTGGLITATGNITGGNIITGGIMSSTGNATHGNISTGGLITATGNVTGANLVTGGVLSVTGNANIGNIGTALITATGNITGANLVTGGVLSVTGNANIGNIGTGGLITATGNITGANIITGGTANAAILTISGNATVGNLIGPHANGNSNIAITANSNIAMTVSGTANVLVVTTSGANIAGALTTTGNVNVGNANAVTWANTSGVRVYTYYNDATSSLDTVFI